MLLGVHPSIAGGLHNAPEEARTQYDAECLQLFTKNQRQWKAKPLTDEDVEQFHAALDEHGYRPDQVFAHASYLINLCNPDAAKQKQSMDALVDELERAATIGILGVCFHPGSHLGKGEAFGVERIGEAIRAVIERAPEGPLLMVEGTAGTGNNLGQDIAHLGAWMDVADEDRLALTLDTCHLHAAGYDLRGDAYGATMDAFDEAFGLDRVRAWHLNDSVHELGSNKDRHEAIGEGEIGLSAFENLVNDPRWQGTISSLETDPETYAEDLSRLRKLRTIEP